MPVESGTTISQLDQTWPLGSDNLQQGDDHIRFIKSVLIAQFPGALGQGFNEAIVATEAELNYLSGVTSNVQDQINSITSDVNFYAPSGTVMVFYQVAPPLGWTQVITHANAMLRVIALAGGGSGGTDNPIAPDLAHLHTTGDHTLVIGEMPSHTHVIGEVWTTAAGHVMEDGGGHNHNQTPGVPSATSVGGDGFHNHGNTGAGNLSFTPMYIDTILASKD